MPVQPLPFESPIYVTRPLLPPLASLNAKLEQIWNSAWLTNGGAQHQALERELCRYLNTEYLSLFNNGTIALITACQALRLQGEVITTPFTFPATPHVLSWNNLTPVFCDIDPESMTIDCEKIESCITNRTSAILGVHVYGIPCYVEAIHAIAQRHGLRIIYDAAHAFGTEVDGTPIVNFGDASMLSFHSTKLFHTAEGGALVVRDTQVKHRVDHLKNFGIKDEETVLMPGINGKMNEIQAALGLITLAKVPDEQFRRSQIAKIYNEELSGINDLEIVYNKRASKNSMQYYVVKSSKRNWIHSALKRYNVYSRKYFYPLCSSYSCYSMLPSASPDLLKNAHKVVDEVLCLPFYGTLSDTDVLRICNIIRYELHR